MLKDAFFNHFSSQFDYDREIIALRLGSFLLNRLKSEDAIWLQRDFSIEEIELALRCSSSEKSAWA